MRRTPEGRAAQPRAGSAAVVAVALLVVGCGGQPATEQATPAPAPPAVATSAPPPTPEPAPPPAPVTDPVGISIPAIGVDADIVPVGLADDGAMETPDFGIAGWYTEGPRPGEVGPAVVVAHVDSRAGPDVFYRLSELQPGDEVTITQSGGATSRFVVESSEQTDKDELPAERIWNGATTPVLRLVTCGGEFDESVRHYTDNIIVYASAA